MTRKDPIWLDRQIIDQMQEHLVQRFGGSFGVRDSGLIDAALARAKVKWSYDPDCDLAACAAAYAFGLVKNHGYVDGNKRIAYMAMYTFLAVNGFKLNVPEPEAVLVMLQTACSDRSEEEFAAWLREQFAAQSMSKKKRVMRVQETTHSPYKTGSPRKKPLSRDKDVR